MGKGMGEANNVQEENKQMLLNLNQPFFKSDADRLSDMLRLLFHRSQAQDKVIEELNTEMAKMKDALQHKAGKATVENLTNRLGQLDTAFGALGVDELQASIRANTAKDEARDLVLVEIKEKLSRLEVEAGEARTIAQEAKDGLELKQQRDDAAVMDNRIAGLEAVLADHYKEVCNLQNRMGGTTGIPESFESRKEALEQELLKDGEGVDHEAIAHEIAVLEAREADNIESRMTDAEGKIVELLQATKTALAEGRLGAWEDMVAMIQGGGSMPPPPRPSGSGYQDSKLSSGYNSPVPRPPSANASQPSSSRPPSGRSASGGAATGGFAGVAGPPPTLGGEALEKFGKVEVQIAELLKNFAAGLLSGGPSAEVVAGLGNQNKHLGDLGEDMKMMLHRIDAADAHLRQHDDGMELLKEAIAALREDLGGVSAAAYMAPGLAAQMDGLAMELQALRKKVGGKSVMQAFVSGLASAGGAAMAKPQMAPAPAAPGVSGEEVTKLRKLLEGKAGKDDVAKAKDEAVHEALEAYNRLMLAMEEGENGRALKFKCLSCDRDINPKRPIPVGGLPSSAGLLPQVDGWTGGAATPATPAGPGLYAVDIRNAQHRGEYNMHARNMSPPRSGISTPSQAYSVSPRQAGGRPRSGIKPRPATAGARFARTPRHDVPAPGAGVDMSLRPQGN